MFQSLTRDSNHSNTPSVDAHELVEQFQSLTRDSNHSNPARAVHEVAVVGFNPSRGIAIIQTAFGRAARPAHGFNPSRGIAIIQT